jgi:N6-L-threonylcarbamoyladenine synthase
MRVLGIETSCDETSASVVENGRKILSNVISSQIKIHKEYSGVVPELAARAHTQNINYVIAKALSKAKIKFLDISKKIDAIAYTRGPGLAGSLLIGQITAMTMSYAHEIALIDVNHIEGHLFSAMLDYQKLKPPYLGLVVSGGHTELVIVEDYGRYKYLGGTRDDAAGEAFDKTAKLLSLSYPGGPMIDSLAKKGNASKIKFPRPYLWGSWDFSFSGLKTAVVNYTRKNGVKNVYDICAGFQAAVVETLTAKTFAAAKKYNLSKIVLGGGVSANSALRKTFLETAVGEKKNIYLPSIELCTDNAAMIACAGYYKSKKLGLNRDKFESVSTQPGMKLINW